MFVGLSKGMPLYVVYWLRCGGNCGVRLELADWWMALDFLFISLWADAWQVTTAAGAIPRQACLGQPIRGVLAGRLRHRARPAYRSAGSAPYAQLQWASKVIIIFYSIKIEKTFNQRIK